MRDGGRVSDFPYFDLSFNRFHAHLPFQVARLDAEIMGSELPKVKAQADHYGKLWMYAGKVARDDGVECSHNRQFPAVFLREITECKKLYLNFNTSIKPRKRRC
jgi:hypothetical protein